MKTAQESRSSKPLTVRLLSSHVVNVSDCVVYEQDTQIIDSPIYQRLLHQLTELRSTHSRLVESSSAPQSSKNEADGAATSTPLLFVPSSSSSSTYTLSQLSPQPSSSSSSAASSSSASSASDALQATLAVELYHTKSTLLKLVKKYKQLKHQFKHGQRDEEKHDDDDHRYTEEYEDERSRSRSRSGSRSRSRSSSRSRRSDAPSKDENGMKFNVRVNVEKDAMKVIRNTVHHDDERRSTAQRRKNPAIKKYVPKTVVIRRVTN